MGCSRAKINDYENKIEKFKEIKEKLENDINNYDKMIKETEDSKKNLEVSKVSLDLASDACASCLSDDKEAVDKKKLDSKIDDIKSTINNINELIKSLKDDRDKAIIYKTTVEENIVSCINDRKLAETSYRDCVEREKEASKGYGSSRKTYHWDR